MANMKSRRVASTELHNDIDQPSFIPYESVAPAGAHVELVFLANRA